MHNHWEDSLLERKTESDLGDLLKTMVAFANSVAEGHVAVILIGELDDGIVQGVTNPDNIQKKIRQEAEKIYPDIVWRSIVYQKDGKACVRLEIEYSGETPHFGGPAWVRRGSETVKSSAEIFQRLIETRSSKVREISKWKGRQITLSLFREPETTYNKTFSNPALLIDVNQFYATVEQNHKRASYPLRSLLIAWDCANERLELIGNQDKRPFLDTAGS